MKRFGPFRAVQRKQAVEKQEGLREYATLGDAPPGVKDGELIIVAGNTYRWNIRKGVWSRFNTVDYDYPVIQTIPGPVITEVDGP